MTQTSYFRLFAILILIITVSLTACEKDPGTIGLDLMDENNLNTSYTDTLTVNAHAAFVDSLRTDESSYNVIGSFCDPVFGATTANIVAELWMTENSPNFGTSPVADSMVVYLSYTGNYYGDTTALQQVKVYELDEDIEVDSSYYSNRPCAYKSEILADFTFTPSPRDSVMDPDGTMGTARLAIPLSTDFAARILEADTSNFADNPTFSDFMRGLYIQFEEINSPGQGSLLDVNLLDTRTEVILYYHNTTDTSEFELKCSTYTPRYAQYMHNYSSGDAMFMQQIAGDTTLGAEMLYIQGLGGVKTAISIPGIEDFSAAGTSINEAKLIMEVYNNDTTYAPPANLELLMIDEDDERVLIPDYSEGTVYYGGDYVSSTATYTFHITRYIQNVINGEIDNKGLELIISGGSINAERLVLYGTDPMDAPQDSDVRFRTQVILTTIEN